MAPLCTAFGLSICVGWVFTLFAVASFLEPDGPKNITVGVTASWAMASSDWYTCRHNVELQVELLPEIQATSSLERAVKLKDITERSHYFAMVGPFREDVSMVSELQRIPYLVTTKHDRESVNVYNMLPHDRDIIDCVRSIVQFYNWRQVGLLLEQQTMGVSLVELLDAVKLDVHTFRVDNDTATVQIRDCLRSIRQRAIRQIIVLAQASTVKTIFETAMRLGIIAVPYSWLVVHNGNWSELEILVEDIETNITLVELIPQKYQQSTVSGLESDSGYDLVNGGQGLFATQQLVLSQALALICDSVGLTSEEERKKASSFTTLLDKVRDRGAILPVHFSQTGDRLGFTWNIMVHDSRHFFKWATWTKGRQKHNNELRTLPSDSESGHIPWTERVSVVTIQEKPWMMLKPDVNQSCQGNECYQGFIVDMMELVSKQFVPSLDYELYIVADGAFGSLDADTGLWNGIMAEIISRNATLSLAPLSINKQREEAVDFTKPFRTRGISVLIQTPVSHASFFQFLAPLSHLVWLVILVAMVVVSVALGQFEKHGIPQRRDIARITERESCWFVFGSLVQEGTESTPLTIGGRILTGTWWFFAMILLSSYTANLAAFLTVRKINSPIETVSDLVDQTKIQYGTVKDSGVLAFFQNTEIEPYRTMWTRMSPENHVATTEEGLQRVLKGDYAFLWDDTVISYIVANDCNFTEIGPSFDPKGYGIGVPAGAIYRENLTLAILSLADTGAIDKLQDRWWNGGQCHDQSRSSSGSDTEEIQLENMAGIFFVLVAGLILGFLACIADKYIVPALTNITNKRQQISECDTQSKNNGSATTSL